jgi:toxin ParE1/3/4
VRKRKRQGKPESEAGERRPDYVISAGAREDLLRIQQYFWDQPKVSSTILASIEECASTLAQWPEMGQNCDEISKGLRSFPAGSYMIFYRVIAAQVVLSRVLHQRRDAAQAFSPDVAPVTPRQ